MTLSYRLSCCNTTYSGTCLHLVKDETFRHFRLPEKESTQGESSVGGLAYAEAQVKAAEPPLTYCVPLGRVISGGDDDRAEIDRFIATASGLVEDMYSE